MDKMPAKPEEPPAPPQGPLRRVPRAPTEDDVTGMLSDLKVDRETRLRRISADRTFRSRHLNAVADRRLNQQTNFMEKATSSEEKSMRKEKKTIQKELSSIHREKSLTVDEYLGQVRERNEKIRRASQHSREKRRISAINKPSSDDLKVEEAPEDGGEPPASKTSSTKATTSRSRKKSSIVQPKIS